MEISEMHILFRQLAQQMGLQNNRTILPEQIDMLINMSISDITNDRLKTFNSANDRVITDNSKLGVINELRTLYKVKELYMGTTPVYSTGSGVDLTVYPVNSASDLGLFSCGNFIDTKTDDGDGNIFLNVSPKINALYLVDLAINYRKGVKNKVTAYYPVRIIDESKLADVMQDFILKPRVKTPVAVIYNNRLDLYLGGDYTTGNGIMRNETLSPNRLRVSFIAKPAKVAYLTDIGGTNVNCDLPEFMHVDIVKHAIDLYRISIQGSLYANQQNAQQNQQELARNTARPMTEGYQDSNYQS